MYCYLFFIVVVLGGGILEYLQRFLQCIKYIILELTPLTVLFHPPFPDSWNSFNRFLNKNSIIYKNRKQEGRTSPVWGIFSSGKRYDMERGCRRVNMVQILCTHGCKWKIETC
jgi:hypothetical protein